MKLTQLTEDIDAEARRLGELAEPRRYLGASSIGDDCHRAIWYSFRWFRDSPDVEGRMYRLWNRGHREEDVIWDLLETIGAEVRDYAERLCLRPDGNYAALGWEAEVPEGWQDVSSDRAHHAIAKDLGLNLRQWSFYHGAFGGHCDGMVAGLEDYGLPGWGLLEAKTHNDKSYRDLNNKGVRRSKPKHFRQMQVYMKAFGLPWALYCAVNKNDDSLYFEAVPYAEEVAEALFERAEKIIHATQPPERISNDPSWWLCKFCDFNRVCHRGAPPPRNCRTCAYGSQGEDAWHCRLYSRDVPDDFVPKGCDKHEAP